MSYVETLSAQQKANIGVLVDELNNAGITNPISQAGILAIVSKESSFVPKDEIMTYSAERLVEVFKMPYSKAKSLAGNPQAIANYVYGYKYGNTDANDGWNYRGRGFNGLTFKGNYQKYGDKIGVNLVSQPDKANDVKTASKIQSEFVKNGIYSLKKTGKLSSYNASDVNDFKNTKDSVLAFYHVNTGTGKDVDYIKGLAKTDTLGGMKKALSRVDDLYAYVKTLKKKQPTKSGGALMNGLLVAVLFVSGWIAYRKYKNQAI